MKQILSNSHVQGLGAAGTPGDPSQHKWQTQATSDSPAEVIVAIKGCRTINTPPSGKPRETNDNKKTSREVNIIQTEFSKVSQTLKVNENLTYTLRSYTVVVETPSCVAITLQELGQQCDYSHLKSNDYNMFSTSWRWYP